MTIVCILTTPNDELKREPAGERWCSNRGHGWRPIAEFGIAREKRSGLTTFCRDCDRETALARYHRARSGVAS